MHIDVTLRDFPFSRMGELSSFLGHPVAGNIFANAAYDAQATRQAADVTSQSYQAGILGGLTPAPDRAEDEAFEHVAAHPVVEVAPAAPGIQTDSAGMPWDSRIHAATRATVADGTWRSRRGVEPELTKEVEAELKHVMGLPVVPAAPSYSDVLEAAFCSAPEAPAAPFAPSVGAPAPPPSFTPPTLAIVPAGVAPTASHSESNPTFPIFMRAVTKAFAAKELDQARLQAAVQVVGLPSLPMLASRPDLVGAVAAALGLIL